MASRLFHSKASVVPNRVRTKSQSWNIAAGSELRIAGALTNSSSANPLGLINGGGTLRITSGNFQSTRMLTTFNGTIINDSANMVIGNDGFRLSPTNAAQAAVGVITNGGSISISGASSLRMGQLQSGLAVGAVGFLSPHTLGVGYDNIDRLLAGSLAGRAALIFCGFKLLSWALSLGSGTSGGTLAPLFTIGGALGTVLGAAAIAVLPSAGVDIRMAALVGMAAMFAGASRALLASVVFAFETTRQPIGQRLHQKRVVILKPIRWPLAQ